MRLLGMSVVSYHRFTADFDEKKSVSSHDDVSPFTIGRSSQCSWSLPDPERVISSQHARIEQSNGQFLLFDTSTNGVFVNRSVTPLKKEHPHPLSDGDIVVIGDYEIKISLITQDASVQTVPENEVELNVAAAALAGVAGGNDVDFGVPAGQVVPTMAAASLDSTLNAGLNDAFALPHAVAIGVEAAPVVELPATPASTVNTAAVIPADWGSQFGTPSVAAIHTAEPDGPVPSQVTPISPLSQVPPSPNPLTDESGCLEAFLDGLGISAEQVAQENKALWWRNLGVITKDSLNGLMDSLHKRSEFKETSRINQTTFRRYENNPLKFSSDLDDLIHNLLERKSAGFLPPERAVKEAFYDLESHEAGLLAGVDGAVAALMKLLDPDLIVSRSDRSGGFLGRFQSLESPQHWNRYRQIYSELAKELNDGGKAFYFEDFSKAYEERLKKDE